MWAGGAELHGSGEHRGEVWNTVGGETRNRGRRSQLRDLRDFEEKIEGCGIVEMVVRRWVQVSDPVDVDLEGFPVRVHELAAVGVGGVVSPGFHTAGAGVLSRPCNVRVEVGVRGERHGLALAPPPARLFESDLVRFIKAVNLAL